MSTAATAARKLSDDYFSTPGGSSHLSNIAIRLRDVATVLAEHELQDAADHVARAYGCIMGRLATQNQTSRSD